MPNPDGSFDIYLSQHLSEEARRRCLDHELRHIYRDHFYSEAPVYMLEAEAENRIVNVFHMPSDGGLPLFTSLEALCGYIMDLTASLRAR